MARDGILFTVITPSTGKRPKALQLAVSSVEAAARFAGLGPDQVEVLVGFDGIRGECPTSSLSLRCLRLPRDNDWGNGIRNTLLKLAKGEKILFLDDDNVLKPYAFKLYRKYWDAEMIIGRIDTQLAFDKPFIPVQDDGSLVRQCNVDPLCLCLSRRLVVDRCGGWNYAGRYEADYLNILDWSRRARSTAVLDEIVGVYDAGRSLDNSALSRRQMNLLDRLAGERGTDIRNLGRPAPVILAGAPG
ncbi:glycosyltransferase family 2 protein [Pseudodesulfovibrio tunisiensis]|uniref:glycosyltransferase family 2 protein n=1 Tax=Pseudodesulfovibrio tunisiensis TaxID=463192 RepID=UPI001FB5020C|nr:glycosyltransferase family A protein [Pseudodesulfovibrio tunisiensis]